MSQGDGAQYVIPTDLRMGRGLVNHDPESWNYPAVELLKASQKRSGTKNKSWVRGRAYDQGILPHCVAFAGKGAFNSSPLSKLRPYRARASFNTAEWYQGAQMNDQWAGEAYDGTSALGLCRYLEGRGLISEYRWCFGLDDVLLTLSHIGPVLLGVWWYDGMFEPDPEGFIVPHGAQAGGHEVELTGIRADRGYVTITNSWGTEWGQGGRCKIRFDDLALLLHQDGDAVVLLS